MNDESTKEATPVCAENACPLCGGGKFTWGVAVGKMPLRFKPDNSGWLSKMTVFGGQTVKARRCDACGNIQLFAVK
jgi:hypothetical protein